MRKLIVALLIAFLGVSCFNALIWPTFAQESTEPTTPTPLVVRWVRFRGAVTEWGNDPYHGSVTVNAKWVNRPPTLLGPWAVVDVLWSNEPRPIASPVKPVGQVTFTHYTAKLVRVIAVRMRQENINLNITGIWVVNKVKITSEFDENSVLTKTVREVTPIVTKVVGQLLITEGWKKLNIEIEGIDAIKGIGINQMITTRMINPFSYEGEPTATLTDLFQLMKCFRAMPGIGNYNPELDYNSDSKIDLADLTTVAANMGA
jgi:hypothetical protein